jgi:hypothetical protein
MRDAPHLTLIRWNCLRSFKKNQLLLRRPFLASELKIPHRNGKLVSATGPTLYGLEKAGWVERAQWGTEEKNMPFRTGSPGNAWQVTHAGREAIAACPDTFPGEPVYGTKTCHAAGAHI